MQNSIGIVDKIQLMPTIIVIRYKYVFNNNPIAKQIELLSLSFLLLWIYLPRIVEDKK